GEFFHDKHLPPHAPDHEKIKATIMRRHELSDKTWKKVWLLAWNKHICSSEYGLAGKTLVECSKTPSIDAFLSGMTEAGVGKAMQKRVLGILSTLLDLAVDREIIPRNPIRTMDRKAKP